MRTPKVRACAGGIFSAFDRSQTSRPFTSLEMGPSSPPRPSQRSSSTSTLNSPLSCKSRRRISNPLGALLPHRSACAASPLVNHCLPSSDPDVSIGPRAAQRPPMAPLAKAAGLFSCEPRRCPEKCPATRGTGGEAIAQADLGRALRTVYHSANGRSREQRPASRNNS
jgi:hypothetical protein